MFGSRFVVLTALILMAGACAKPPSNDSSPAAKPASASQGANGGASGGSSNGGDAGGATKGAQVGTGTSVCPFSTDPKDYVITAPESTKALDAIPDGKYVLTVVRTQRATLSSLDRDAFTNAAKIILKEPGRVGTNDTLQVLVHDQKAALTAGNLSFPLEFEIKKGKIDWGRFADYEPKIEVAPKLAIANPEIKDQTEKVLTENTGRHAFNVFTRKRLSGYQTVVQLSGKSDLIVIKGTIEITESYVRFVVEIPRGSSSTDLIESTYELTFAKESKAKAPDCGANASALKVLGS